MGKTGIDRVVSLLRSEFCIVRSFPVDTLLELELQSSLVFNKLSKVLLNLSGYRPFVGEVKHRKYGTFEVCMVKPPSNDVCEKGSLLIDAISLVVDKTMREYLAEHSTNEEIKPYLKAKQITDREILCLDDNEWCRLAPVFVGPAAAIGYRINDILRQRLDIGSALQITQKYPDRISIKCLPPLFKFGRSPLFTCFGSFRPHDEKKFDSTPLDLVEKLLPDVFYEVKDRLDELEIDSILHRIDSSIYDRGRLSVMDENVCNLILEREFGGTGLFESNVEARGQET